VIAPQAPGDGGALDERHRALEGRRLALVEMPDNAAAYQAVAAASAGGARLTLVTSEPGRYRRTRKAGTDPLSWFARVLEADTGSATAVTASLAGIPLDACLSFSDYHVLSAAQAARWLGVPGAPVEAVRAATYKHELREQFAGTRFAVRAVLAMSDRDLTRAVDELGLPMVAKPTAEGSSVGVRIVRDRAELDDAFRQIRARHTAGPGVPIPPGVLLEELLEGPEVSVESLSSVGGVHVYGTTDKVMHPCFVTTEVGHAFPDPRGLADTETFVVDLLQELGYDRGAAHTEVKLTREGPRVVEVNPRLPGAHIPSMVARVCRTDPFLDAMVAHLGLDPRPPSRSQDTSVIRAVVVERPGIVRSVDGVEEARGLPGVFLVDVTARPGDRAGPPEDNTRYLGWVGAIAADHDLARTRVEDALARLRIEVDPDG